MRSGPFWQLQGYIDDDDFYAEILKDDIIKLDETSISAALDVSPLSAITPENVQKSQEPMESIVSEVLPFQGTANRRIRLRKVRAQSSHRRELETSSSNECQNSEESPKCFKSVSSSRITVNRHHILVVLLLLTFMALFLSLLGGFWRVRRIIYNSLYRGFSR